MSTTTQLLINVLHVSLTERAVRAKDCAAALAALLLAEGHGVTVAGVHCCAAPPCFAEPPATLSQLGLPIVLYSDSRDPVLQTWAALPHGEGVAYFTVDDDAEDGGGSRGDVVVRAVAHENAAPPLGGAHLEWAAHHSAHLVGLFAEGRGIAKGYCGIDAINSVHSLRAPDAPVSWVLLLSSLPTHTTPK